MEKISFSLKHFFYHFYGQSFIKTVRGPLNFLFIIYHFKRNRFFAVNDVIHVRTLRHINNDVASHTMTAETETIRAGAKKVKISANPDNLITKMFLAI